MLFGRVFVVPSSVFFLLVVGHVCLCAGGLLLLSIKADATFNCTARARWVTLYGAYRGRLSAYKAYSELASDGRDLTSRVTAPRGCVSRHGTIETRAASLISADPRPQSLAAGAAERNASEVIPWSAVGSQHARRLPR